MVRTGFSRADLCPRNAALYWVPHRRSARKLPSDRDFKPNSRGGISKERLRRLFCSKGYRTGKRKQKISLIYYAAKSRLIIDIRKNGFIMVFSIRYAIIMVKTTKRRKTSADHRFTGKRGLNGIQKHTPCRKHDRQTDPQRRIFRRSRTGDGLDENGDLVPPGTYLLSGLTADGIDGYYESSFYNPGTPAWETGNSASAWGADHMPAHRLAAAGDGVVVCSQFAEGGYGTFLLNTDGEDIFLKRWSEKRGTNAAAADNRYVYIVPNDWSVSGVQLLRMNVSYGSCAPFFRDGAECPMPYPLTDLFGVSAEELPDVLAMTAAGGQLIVRCSDHTVRVIDPENGVQCRVYPLEADGAEEPNRFSLAHGGPAKRSASCSVASDGDHVWYIADTAVYRLDLADGTAVPRSWPERGLRSRSSVRTTKTGLRDSTGKPAASAGNTHLLITAFTVPTPHPCRSRGC